ncbi:sphingosine hydroxylase [Abortiporus biennis]|nr:sphingosine hydroxylase [Abortiporus biennis]
MAFNFTSVPASALHLSYAQQLYLQSNHPFYYTPHPEIIEGVPDWVTSLVAPTVTYWIVSLVFQLLDSSDAEWLKRYRLHESEEVQSKNLVSKFTVFQAVIFQQIIQNLAGYWWMDKDAVSGAGVDHLSAMTALLPRVYFFLSRALGDSATAEVLKNYADTILYLVYWWFIPVGRFFFGMFIIDTWQYFLHRAMHMNTFLYKAFHSVHHRLYVPYAFGALYNHPLEGFVLDTAGAVLAEVIAGMGIREATLLFTVSTMKTVDDHCGYKIPWDPLQFFSSNNADYHDIHHQQIGIKSNFSQPFFIHWDVILGTRMTRKDIEMKKQQRKHGLKAE